MIPVRVFEIPFFDFDDYITIKNSNISFLSDYCFAGYLYYRLGLKHTSPTINMFTDNASYLKFLKDIEWHLHLEMQKVTDIVDSPYLGTYTYPRGRIGDCEWVFSHDDTFEDALERWNKGVKRFNFLNYVVFMTIRSDKAAYEFDSLPIEHKLGFYWKELNLKSVICIPEWNDPKIRRKYYYNFAGIVNKMADSRAGVGRCQNIDWMRFLLFKDNFIRKR